MHDQSTQGLPAAEQQYLKAMAHMLRERLGDALVGVYLFGSAASGAYEPGPSDLDMQAVVRRPLPDALLCSIAGDLSHDVLPCPARRLDFVVYEQRAVERATRHPRFAMNFNTGSDLDDALSFDPTDDISHWFLLDIAMARIVGRTLYGADLATVFAPVPRLWQLEAIADSLAWHQEYNAVHPNNVLNACRGWRYAITDTMGSKLDGAAWAQQQPDCPPVVAQAVAHRTHDTPIDGEEAHALAARIAAAVQEAIARER